MDQEATKKPLVNVSQHEKSAEAGAATPEDVEAMLQAQFEEVPATTRDVVNQHLENSLDAPAATTHSQADEYIEPAVDPEVEAMRAQLEQQLDHDFAEYDKRRQQLQQKPGNAIVGGSVLGTGLTGATVATSYLGGNTERAAKSITEKLNQGIDAARKLTGEARVKADKDLYDKGQKFFRDDGNKVVDAFIDQRGNLERFTKALNQEAVAGLKKTLGDQYDGNQQKAMLERLQEGVQNLAKNKEIKLDDVDIKTILGDDIIGKMNDNQIETGKNFVKAQAEKLQSLNNSDNAKTFADAVKDNRIWGLSHMSDWLTNKENGGLHITHTVMLGAGLIAAGIGLKYILDGPKRQQQREGEADLQSWEQKIAAQQDQLNQLGV